MTEEEIVSETEKELKKNSKELIKDIIREANEIPKKATGEKENLDIIKHLIKRLTIHQIVLEERASKTNFWLIILSIIMAIGAVFSFLSFFRQ